MLHPPGEGSVGKKFMPRRRGDGTVGGSRTAGGSQWWTGDPICEAHHVGEWLIVCLEGVLQLFKQSLDSSWLLDG